MNIGALALSILVALPVATVSFFYGFSILATLGLYSSIGTMLFLAFGAAMNMNRMLTCNDNVVRF